MACSRPSPDSISRSSFREKYYEVKLLGSGAFAVVYLAVEKRLADDLHVKAGRTGCTQPYDELRQHIVAIKIPNDLAFTSISAEIHLLTQVLTEPPPCLIRALDSHCEGKAQWLAVPLVSGGDLQSFVEQFDGAAVSVAFIWHVILQSVAGLAYLDFGIKDLRRPQPIAGWPCIAHGDFHLGNLFLGPGSRDSPFNYPQIVVADFGEAMYSASTEDTTIHREGRLGPQIRDLQWLGECVEQLLCYLEDPDARGDTLRHTVHWLNAIGDMDLSEPTQAKPLEVLTSLASLADKERGAHYRPLTDEIVAYIASDKDKLVQR